jgi:hypothetical protein
MASKDFLYSTTISTGVNAGRYSWSAGNNWNPSAVPDASSDVSIGRQGTNRSVDDIASLSINSLTISMTMFIAPGGTLRVTGSAPGHNGVSILAAPPFPVSNPQFIGMRIRLQSGSTLIATGSGDDLGYGLATNTLLSLGGDFVQGGVKFDGTSTAPQTFELTGATAGLTGSSATILNFHVGDGIWFDSAPFATGSQVVQSGGGLLLEDASGDVLYSFGSFQTAAGTSSLGVIALGSGVEIVAICFAQGTLIATADGETPVEELAEGDMVATLENGRMVPRAVKWIGHRRVNLAAHPHPERAAPVRIRAGAIAEGEPARDLVVSPDHCLFIDGKLIPARLLVNDATIVQDRDLRAVTYYHVELDRHAVLLAEGLPAESYLDTGNRAFFSNAGLALVLHPEFQVNSGLRCWAEDACAPLAVSEAAVGPVWMRIADRATERGQKPPRVATTSDAGLCLVANGRTIHPVSLENQRHVFVLPRGTEGVTIVSRAGMATDLVPYSDDGRLLGVAVSRIVVSRGADRIEVPVDHPMLDAGWHSAERADGAMWRWTDGAAFLPIPPANSGIVTVELDLRGTMAYRVADAGARRAA